MAPNDSDSTHRLMGRARIAYEWGRLRAGVPWLLAVLPLLAIALHFSGRPRATVANGALLAVSLVFFQWRGGSLSRAVLPGFVGGVLAFLLPLIACSTGICSRDPSPRLILLCSLAGVLCGTWLTLLALRSKALGLDSVAAAGLVAGLTAALSCAVAGVSGILGLAIGLAAASTPALALARGRA